VSQFRNPARLGGSANGRDIAGIVAAAKHRRTCHQRIGAAAATAAALSRVMPPSTSSRIGRSPIMARIRLIFSICEARKD
jgi:hypothetical protein